MQSDNLVVLVHFGKTVIQQAKNVFTKREERNIHRLAVERGNGIFCVASIDGEVINFSTGFKGNIIKAGVKSDYALYSEELATFGEDNVYNQADSAGFINLFGLPIKVQAQVNAKNNKK